MSRKRKKLTKRLKEVVSLKRTKKNWLYNLDINPDGVWKPRKRKVRATRKEQGEY